MPHHPRPNRRLLLILFAGFFLRIALHDYHGLEGDDAFSLALSRIATAPLITGLLRLELDIHPPLHFLLLKAWTTLSGDSLLSLRLLNTLLDLLTGALIVRLTRQSAAHESAALAALILWALSPTLIFGAWLVRMYTLLSLLVTASAVFALQATRPTRASVQATPHLWSALTVLTLLAALYTHITGAIIAVVIGILLLADALHHSLHRALFIVALLLIAVLAYLPFALPTANLYLSGADLGAAVNPANAVPPLAVPSAIPITALVHRLALPSPIGIGVILLLISGWRFPHQRRLIALALATYAGLVLLGTVAGLYKPRYIVPFTPLLIAPLAAQIAIISRQQGLNVARLLLFIGLVMGGSWGIVRNLDRTWRDDWTAATAFVADHTLPGDVVLVVPDWGQEAFRYHYPSTAPVRGFFPQISPDLDFAPAFEEYVRDADRVWLVRYQPPVSDASARTSAWFNERAAFVTAIFPAGMEITLFDQQRPVRDLPADAQRINVQFGDRLMLRGFITPDQPVTAADRRLYDGSGRALVTLYWEAQRRGSPITPRVRLTDTFGQVYGEALAHPNSLPERYPVNRWAPGSINRVTYDINLNPQTPPGQYNVEVMALDPTGQPASTHGEGAGDYWAVAGTVTVR